MPQTASLTALPVADRLQIIENLWDSIEGEPLPLPDWHRAENDRRLLALDAGVSAGVPCDGVCDHIAGRT